jgi:hypothetical protein
MFLLETLGLCILNYIFGSDHKPDREGERARATPGVPAIEAGNDLSDLSAAEANKLKTLATAYAFVGLALLILTWQNGQ